jgi:outer membrane lipoprotein SlyB
MKKIFSFLVIALLLNSCATNPNVVSGNDAQKLLTTQLATVIDIQPVTIEGKNSEIAAGAGAVLGGLAGNTTKGKYRELITAAGAILGAAIGYYAPVKLGEHNGFQYTLNVENESKPLTVVQGLVNKDDSGFKVGQKVTIVFGKDNVRVLPTNIK